MKIAFTQVVAAAALSAAAVSAQAASLKLTDWAAASGQGYVSASVADPAFNNVASGAFKGTLDGTAFITYCVQLTQTFNWNTTYVYGPLAGAQYFDAQIPDLATSGADIVSRLGRLFTHLGGVIAPATTEESAAIQLAVWESIYESGTALSLGGGAFHASVTGANSANVLTLANGMLSAAALLTNPLYDITVLKNADHQDFLQISRNSTPNGGTTPEPASLGLVALALGGLALSRRRRRA